MNFSTFLFRFSPHAVMLRLGYGIHSPKGQGLTEYTLVLVLVALAAYGALSGLGESIDVALGKASAALDGQSVANTPPICETAGSNAKPGGGCGGGGGNTPSIPSTPGFAPPAPTK